MWNTEKQLALKPQDLLVALKLAVNPDIKFTYSDLSKQLAISTSEIHGAAKRAEISRLVTRNDTELVANNTSLREFLIHGVTYAFPAVTGGLVRGMPTGTAGPSLNKMFNDTHEPPTVWPDSEGTEWGISILPLYHSVPTACRLDEGLYEVLTWIDALRVGAARGREYAIDLIMRRLR